MTRPYFFRLIGEEMVKKETFFALDLSLTQTGLTVFEVAQNRDAKPVFITSINTKKVKTRSGKLDHIAKELLKLRKKYNPSSIAYERGFSRFHNSTQALFQVSGVCLYIFNGLEQDFYPPATIKKGVGGYGKMTKKELREKVEEMYPKVTFKNEDESDSFAVGLYHVLQRGEKNG